MLINVITQITFVLYTIKIKNIYVNKKKHNVNKKNIM